MMQTTYTTDSQRGWVNTEGSMSVTLSMDLENMFNELNEIEAMVGGACHALGQPAPPVGIALIKQDPVNIQTHMNDIRATIARIRELASRVKSAL